MRLEEAKELLLNNNRGGYTVPSPNLYPFQWNWDAGFVALGLAHFDREMAYAEIINMFKGQWRNGMLPHINFHHLNEGYFPGPEVWRTVENPMAPDNKVFTSGIAQPPVFGFILAMMADFLAEDQGFISLVKEIYPKIVEYHRYLYDFRDPYREGLVYIMHNWESGTDNSPLWDAALNRIDIRKARDVAALRRDINNVDASQRPTNDNYKRYIYLIDLFVEYGYNDLEIFNHCPFIIQDTLFNSLLIRSNEGLIKLAALLGESSLEIEAWNKKSKLALNKKCWDEAEGFYFDYDLKINEPIKIKVSNGLMPLFAGTCTQEQATRLKESIFNNFYREGWYLCSSCAFAEPSFNPIKYWRGPVWINVNWMLYHGLIRYRFMEEAERVKADSIKLVENYGFYEYFNPNADYDISAQGIGSDKFSWTAALYIDFLKKSI